MEENRIGKLNRSVLDDNGRRVWEAVSRSPVTVLQIGEGNFLRGFADWMLDGCRRQGLYEGGVAVVQPRPSGKGNIEKLASQDGLYTLVTRGLKDGKPVERRDIVTVFAKAFDPYANWSAFLELAVSPELRWVISNTTEAGLAYRPEELTGGPIQSFPGKMAYLLYLRFMEFQGAADRGLYFLPCELLERNGDCLRDAVLRYADDWGLSQKYKNWVKENNRFLNSLVDRIVSGYPDQDQAERWFVEWGYEDALLNTAEPYHLWAIEADPALDDELPLRRAGFEVHWVNDIKPYQQRKVRILNGAHTLMAPLGILYGLSHVREVMEDPVLGSFIRDSVEQEIIPTLPYTASEMLAYARTVFERFLNPYICHRLQDIAMNSVSKFKVRLLPSLAYYQQNKLQLPERLVRGFAGLIRYYRVRRIGDRYEGKDFKGRTYTVREDGTVLERFASLWGESVRGEETTDQSVRRLLGESEIWGIDLAAWEGLTEAVSRHFREWGY